jgi:DMSO/TMAO reductase YedYZ molybdopterin-dependent catalytic subunit
MDLISRGFTGRSQSEGDRRIPPGQYRTDDFPVLSAGPTPRITTEQWQLSLVDEAGGRRTWTWADLMALPIEDVTVDIHCVTRWSRLDTNWRGVSVDSLLEDADDLDVDAGYILARSYGGYSTNLPIEDVTDGKAWIAFEHEGDPLDPEHGGPARLLVPHLYFWKSAKWIRSIELRSDDEPGFWETLGYHEYGDPWLEQRYTGD